MVKLRVARPVTDISRSQKQYEALGLQVLTRCGDEAGFEGVMLGVPGEQYHLELTRSDVKPSPTVEDLLVFYLPDANEFNTKSEDLMQAGWERVQNANRYWDIKGRTFKDGDGYQIVLQNAEWTL